MRPLTTTLSPAEVADLLELSPAVVDALLASGRILCHVKSGEARVPLAQLEEFFREGLVKVYRAEAQVAEPASAAREPEPLPVIGDPLPEPPRERLESVETLPSTNHQAPATPAEPPDLRRTPRYVPRRQIDGIYDDIRFTIVQISATGLRIRHREPLVPGSEAKLTFALLNPARSVVVRARVVWTSLASAGEDRFAISGLRVIEHGERLARAVDSLLETHELQPERRTRPRRASDATTILSASDDEIALITSAMQKFAADPVEASRWYSRARFALSDENVRRVAPRRPREREEVLGIWEYLERQIDIEKVANVVNWGRAS